jgi:hypothetical protein
MWYGYHFLIRLERRRGQHLGNESSMCNMRCTTMLLPYFQKADISAVHVAIANAAKIRLHPSASEIRFPVSGNQADLRRPVPKHPTAWIRETEHARRQHANAPTREPVRGSAVSGRSTRIRVNKFAQKKQPPRTHNRHNQHELET